jgi:hypothetical protein
MKVPRQDCVAFLKRLASVAEGVETDHHSERCATCAAHLAAARANIRLLASLPKIEMPGSSAEQLAAIHVRASVELEKSLGGLLASALTPMTMPEQAGWQDTVLESQRPVADRLQVRPVTAPGWLWTRVRNDLQAFRAARRGRSRLRWLAAAAAVLVSGFLIRGFLSRSGTGVTTEIVFVRLAAPPSPGMSPTGVIREIGRMAK